jgi:AcrR family transcriptional regulator
MGAKTARRHLQGDESRERILDATIEIASLRGFHGTSISEVSKRSGLPASSIYWHFASKDDLVAAVIQRSFDTWLADAVRAAVRPPDVAPSEHLVASMRRQAAGLVESPEFIRLGLMLALEQHPKEPTARALFLHIRQRSLDMVCDSIGHLIAELRGSPDADLARRVARLVMAAADGLFIAYQIDPHSMDLLDEFQLLAEMMVGHLTYPAVSNAP